MSRSRRSDIGYFLAGVLLAVGLVLSFGVGALTPRAQATAAPGCITPPKAGVISAKQVDNYMFTSRGTRAEVRVINGSGVNCQHVSSIFAWNGYGGFEFGYLIGYSGCPEYAGNYHTNPKRFFTAVNSQGGLVDCGVWTGTALPEGTFQTFQGSDTNANGRWGAWYNGSELQPNGILLDYNSAYNGWGMERGNRSDDGYSRFNELSEFHDNTTGGWSLWDDQRINHADDPDYHYDEIDDHTGRTVQ